MKKLVATLCLSAVASVGFSQGLINFANTIATKISTNSVAQGGATGVTGIGANSFYYALLTAPSTVSTVDANLQNLLSSTWTFTGQLATNSGLSGRLIGNSGAAATGWAPASTNSYIVVGWSSNLGADWNTIKGQLNGASLAGGQWNGSWSALGFFGASSVGFGQAGGVDPSTGLSLNPYNLFGTASAGGTPITSGFSMFVTAVPEPGTIALAGLGAAALMIFRRRK